MNEQSIKTRTYNCKPLNKFMFKKNKKEVILLCKMTFDDNLSNAIKNRNLTEKICLENKFFFFIMKCYPVMQLKMALQCSKPDKYNKKKKRKKKRIKRYMIFFTQVNNKTYVDICVYSVNKAHIPINLCVYINTSPPGNNTTISNSLTRFSYDCIINRRRHNVRKNCINKHANRNCVR
jgi:hypothetical protein